MSIKSQPIFCFSLHGADDSTGTKGLMHISSHCSAFGIT
uniref:Uncharacterized protein n=1 Tax=Rhizophora mucronata TaxID=61149 RepID=A0A2P2N6N7_RHIMU